MQIHVQSARGLKPKHDVHEQTWRHACEKHVLRSFGATARCPKRPHEDAAARAQFRQSPVARGTLALWA